jgi:transcriptional regulator with XRE-family HTH domain
MDDAWLRREFGALIRQLRRKVGMTQDAVAEGSGLSRTSVVNIESGRQGVSLETLYRLAEALACDATALLPALPRAQMPRIAIGDDSEESKQAVMRVLQRARSVES